MRTSVDVHNFLQDLGIAHEICTMEEPPRTAKRAAALLGLKPCEVAKCVVVIADEIPVLVLVPADRRLDLGKVAKTLGAKSAKMARVEEAVRVTGYLLGATPPVALETKVKTLVDRGLVALDLIYTGGGEPNAILKIRPADLVSIGCGEVVDIVSA